MKYIIIAFLLVEIYYWFIYVPRAWKKPGTNRSIDDIKYAWDRVNFFTGEPKQPKE